MVLISKPLHPGWSGGSAGRLHCGLRPRIPHQAKIRPQTSSVSKTRNLAVFSGSAWGVAPHWPVASYSKPWKGQTSRPSHMRPPVAGPGRSPGVGKRPRRRRRARSRHTKRLCSPPIQVFWMSVALSMASRLATKYQPSGNGEGRGAFSGLGRSVDVIARLLRLLPKV